MKSSYQYIVVLHFVSWMVQEIYGEVKFGPNVKFSFYYLELSDCGAKSRFSLLELTSVVNPENISAPASSYKECCLERCVICRRFGTSKSSVFTSN